MGDPGGIGAEVILKALRAMKSCDFEAVIYGSSQILEFEDPLLGDGPEMEVVDVAPEISWSKRPVGPTGERGAILQGRALDAAMKAVDNQEIDAIVTAPWNKALFAAIDEPVVGHTEVLSEYFGVDDTVMMLAGARLRVALVTTHVAVAEISDLVTPDALESTIRVCARALQSRFGIEAPRLAVCGLNPHAGEKGHMGREEIDVIAPVISRLNRQWEQDAIALEGPFPSDTLFARFREDAPYDAVICLYHDQGLIPLKLLHFGGSANITLGLPVIRTSVDHGTAYDIAGQSVADAGSMKYALEMAHQMVRRARAKI